MTLTADTFRQLRFTGLLLLLALIAAAGGVYFTSIQQQQRYLSSRDFRLLSVLASQTQNLIEGDARMFQGAIAHTGDMSVWLTDARPSVPILKDVELAKYPSAAVAGKTVARFTLESEASRSRLRLDVAPDGVEDPVLTLRVGVAALLGPTFESKLRHGVFDTLALATPDGRVAFASGRRQQELQSTSLDTVLTPKELEGGKTFQQLSRTISVRDAVIAGVDYKLYIQPCCASVTGLGSVNAKPGDPPRGGMILAGLIESETANGAALAISPDLVIIGIVLTLLALVVWPFLKLTFLGERQRVTLWDLVQLGACSIFGLALGTIIIITSDVYTRLTADVDEQLEGLAHDLTAHISGEVGFAYQQLSTLEQQFHDRPAGVVPRTAGENGYPDYDTFALIDEKGLQHVKTGPLDWVPTLISVRERMYFEAVSSRRYWQDLSPCRPPRDEATARAASPPPAAEPGGCFMESLWSWTTGQQQAVLSKPTSHKALPVAALAIRMRSLINPVLPPGFEYAVIDGNGAVLFHSDPQRNVLEDLFIETDRDRRLRAMIAGHSSGAFSTMYWGRPYRAYVKSAGVPGWSIVTLFEKQGTRGLVLEWTAVSLLLLSVYLVAWVLVILGALKLGASWLWPDARRRSGYMVLVGVYTVLLLTFVAVAFSGNSHAMLVVGIVVSIAAWVAAFLVLRKRPPAIAAADTRGSRNAASEYALAGALFLVLSGVVPGVAFVVRSYDLHIESYVKHRQLGLARSLVAAGARTDTSDRAAPGPELGDLDRYYSFFYGTSVEARNRSAAPPEESEGHHDMLLSMLEEYLPYYTESSVAMRELLHERADDGTWVSRRTPDGHLELRVTQDTPGTELVVSSMLPALTPFSGGASAEGGAAHRERTLIMPYLTPVLLVCLGLVAYAIVAFLLRHVYLASVYEPLWATGPLVATSGDNVLVLCEDSQALAAQIQGASKLALGPIARNDAPTAAWTQARMKISGGEPGRAVVITDLDTDLEDVHLTHTKVELLEELVNDPARTVVVLLQNPTAVLQGSVRPEHHGADRALWARLLKAFVILDRRAAPADPRGPIPVTVTPPPRSAWRRWMPRDMPAAPTGVEAVLEQEGLNDRFVKQLCDDIRESQALQSGSLSREQVLDEIEERAAGYYQRLWDSCSDDEKVVLGHVALYGLTNAASRRVVRRLLVRRLLTKDPDLRLMNRTFRNFILAPRTLRQVAKLEGLAEPSTWDRLRLPFALAAFGAGAFLFTTQRDMFNQTVTGLAALAAAVPTVLRAVSVMAKNDAGPAPPSANA